MIGILPWRGNAQSSSSSPGKLGEIPEELRDYKEYLTAPELEIPTISMWDHLISVRAGGGYSDNVLLSYFSPQSSAYVSSGMDASVFRLWDTGAEVTLFASGDDTRYLDTTQINGQDLATVVAQLKFRINERWKGRFGLDYVFQHQVIDGSVYAGQFIAVPAEGHTFSAHPAIIREFGTNYSAELEWRASRQIFSSPLDSYWQTGPKITLRRVGVIPSEIALSYEADRIMWDTLSEVDSKGNAIPGTVLSSWDHQVSLRLQQYLDGAHHWSSITSLGYDYSANDGSSYNDYVALRASQEFAFRAAPWRVSARAAYTYYRFPWQASFTTPSLRRNQDQLSFSLRLERNFGRHFKAFIQGENQQSNATENSDRYRMNNINGGIEFEF